MKHNYFCAFFTILFVWAFAAGEASGDRLSTVTP